MCGPRGSDGRIASALADEFADMGALADAVACGYLKGGQAFEKTLSVS